MISITKNNPRTNSKTYHFKEPHELNLTRYARFPRRLVKDGVLAHLSPSACAVLPVLYCLCDSKRVVRHSIERIAFHAGLERHAASRGIQELISKSTPYQIKTEPHVTENGHSMNWLFLPRVGDQNGDFFPFRHCLIESGIWAKVSDAGKRAYLALRTFNDVFHTKLDDIAGMEDCYLSGGLNSKEQKDVFGKRLLEVCTAEEENIKRYSGINTSETLQKAFDSLERCGLMEDAQDGGEGWRVYLVPQRLFPKLSWSRH